MKTSFIKFALLIINVDLQCATIIVYFCFFFFLLPFARMCFRYINLPRTLELLNRVNFWFFLLFLQYSQWLYPRIILPSPGLNCICHHATYTNLASSQTCSVFPWKEYIQMLPYAELNPK